MPYYIVIARFFKAWVGCGPIRAIIPADLPADRSCGLRRVSGQGKGRAPRGSRRMSPDRKARRRWRLARSGRPEAQAAGRGRCSLPAGRGSGRDGPGWPWTVRKARRPPAGPARSDRHGSIGLETIQPARNGRRRGITRSRDPSPIARSAPRSGRRRRSPGRGPLPHRRPRAPIRPTWSSPASRARC